MKVKETLKRVLAVILSAAMVLSGNSATLLAEEVIIVEDNESQDELITESTSETTPVQPEVDILVGQEPEVSEDTDTGEPDSAQESETDLPPYEYETETRQEETEALPGEAGGETEPELESESGSGMEEELEPETGIESESEIAEPESGAEEIYPTEILIEEILEAESPALTEETEGLEGDGSEDNPYIIKTEAQLMELGKEDLSTTNQRYYILNNDIELESTNWIPIGGDGTNGFAGVFDGCGYTISGLRISGADYQKNGLFGCIAKNGVIRNLTVIGEVEGSYYIGLLAGENEGTIESCRVDGAVSGGTYAGGLVGGNRGTLDRDEANVTVTGEADCAGGLVGRSEEGTITDCSTEGEVRGTYRIGGLVGTCLSGSIENSHASVDVFSEDEMNSYSYVGGLAGCATVPVVNCSAEGNVSGTKSDAGGLIGIASDAKVTDSWAGGTVTSESGNTGGLIGSLERAEVTNCYARGKVNGENAGGLIGSGSYVSVITSCYALGAVEGSSRAGGLAGEFISGQVLYSYAQGDVSGGGYTGGLVGYSSVAIENCYARGNVNGTGSSTGGLVGVGRYIRFCYASGSVNDTEGAGLAGTLRGTLGGRSGVVLQFCYYDEENAGNHIGIPVSSTLLKRRETFAGWDFDHIWAANNNYPVINLRGEPEAPSIEGSGMPEDPYVIMSEEQLAALAANILPLTGSYVLGVDLTLRAENWTPIGANDESFYFKGVFDGKGHSISGLKISGLEESYQGLFGYNAGTIRNLTVTGDVDAVGSSDAAILAGCNNGVIENCQVSGSVTSHEGGAGGLVCNNASEGTIADSASDVAVKAEGGSDMDVAGGFVGDNDGTIERCKSSGTVEAYLAGGFAGLSGGFISSCASRSDVYGQEDAGGFVCDGYYGKFENCYARGSVTNESDSYTYAGGFAGSLTYADVVNCYSTGLVSAGVHNYGFVGSNAYSSLTGVYYCSTTSGCTDSNYATPLSRGQMGVDTNFDGWDFVDTWGLYPTINGGFPFLLWEVETERTDNRVFWYEAEESKKGFAVTDQDMKIFMAGDPSASVTFTVEYKENQEEKTQELQAAYKETSGAFEAAFHIGNGIQEISGLTAHIGGVDELAMESSFWNQLPLRVEGILQAEVKEEIAEKAGMSLKLFNEKGGCVGTYKMDGTQQIEFRALVQGTYSAVLCGGNLEFARKDEIEVVQGETTTVSFLEVPELASVRMVFTSGGKRLNDPGLEVNFFDVSGQRQESMTGRRARTLEKGTKVDYLAEGDIIGYSLHLNGYRYMQDKEIYEKTLKAGENVIELEVKELQTISVPVKVTDEATGDVISGAAVNVTQLKADSYQTYGNTDESGECSLRMMDVDAEIVVSKRGYGTKRLSLSLEELQKGVSVELGGLKGILEFSLSAMGKRLSSADPSDSEISTAPVPSKITLTRKKTGKQVELLLGEWPFVYEDGMGWETGETFSAEIYTQGYEPLTLETEVNEYGNMFFAGILQEKGGLSISADWLEGLSSGFNSFLLFDAQGKRCAELSSNEEIVQINDLTAGTYTLAAADNQVGLLFYQTLQELQMDSSIEGQWESLEVTVTNGIIEEVSIEIPVLQGSSRLIRTSESSYTASTEYARVGDGISIRAQYVLEKISAGDKTAVLSIPEGTSLIKNSVSVDGQAAEATPTEDGTFSVPVEGDELLVRYSVRVLDLGEETATGELDFIGRLNYTLDGEAHTELLGRAKVHLNEVTLSVPKETNYSSLNVSGIAPGNTLVEIYDGDVLIGQANANKYGSYKTTVELVERGRNTVHLLKAVIREMDSESEVVKVQYGRSTATPVSFSLTYDGTKHLTIANPTQGIGNMSIYYDPSKPFEFVIHFDDNRAVTMVYTKVTLTNGSVQKVPMTYNAAYDYWEGSTYFNSGVPKQFAISYMPVTYAAREAESSMVFVQTDASASYEDGNTIGKILTMLLDDANHTKARVLVEVEKNVSFTPTDEYKSIDLNGTNVWFKNETKDVEHDGVTYLVIEYYTQLSDGSYALCRRGVEKELLPRQNKSEAYQSAKELVDVVRDSKDSGLAEKADQWDQKLQQADQSGLVADAAGAVKNAAQADSGQNAGTGAEPGADSTWDDLAKDAADVAGEIQKQAAQEEADRSNEVNKEMLSDPGVMDYLQNGNKASTSSGRKPGSTFRKVKDDREKEEPASNVSATVDPSGFVYETFEDMRLPGVTAELYFENDRKFMQFWDAEEYDQVNPQITDEEGKYGWNVPEGMWQVIYKKDGYETTKSDIMEVPPPRMDVNIEMVSDEAAEIAGQTCQDNKLTLVFDKYLLMDSLGAGKITVSNGQEALDTELEFEESGVRTYEGQKVVRSVVLTLKDGYFPADTYQVTVAKGVQTYCGTICPQMTSQLTVAEGEKSEASYKVTIPDHVTVTKTDKALKDGDKVRMNDILKITAEESENVILESLSVNGTPFESGGYYTVTDQDVVIEAEFDLHLPTCRVTFDSQGGSQVDSVEAEEGSRIEKPADPQKNGSAFGGWYRDTSYQTEWDFDQDTVSGDLTLYAKWDDPLYTVTLEQKEASVQIGESLVLKADVETNMSTVPGFIWESSAPEVATVEEGTVTALTAGQTEIKVSLEGRPQAYDVCQITVVKLPQQITAADSLVRNLDDGSFSLNAVLTEGDGTLSYVSFNPAVAEISEDGTVKLLQAGVAQLLISASETATYEYTEKIVTLTVQPASSVPSTPSTPSTPADPATCTHTYGSWKTVKEPDVLNEGQQEAVCTKCGNVKRESIAKLAPILKLNATNIPLKVKQSTKAVKVTEMQKGDSIVSWVSTNKKVVTVNASGKITGKKKGSAKVVVTLKSGVSAAIKVKVQKKAVKAKKVTLPEKSVTLKKGQSYKLAPTVTPITCVEKKKYTSSKPKVATVSAKGVIKAKSKGKAKITVKVGKKKVVCTVTVK